MKSVFMILAVTAVVISAEPEGNKDLGKHIMQNMTMLSTQVVEFRGESLKMLFEPPIQEELKLTDNQLARLVAIGQKRQNFSALLAKHTSRKLGELSIADMAELQRDIQKEVEAENGKIEGEIEDALTERQFSRLKEIYLQRILISDDRRGMLAGESLELSIDFSKHKKQLVERMGSARTEVQARIRQLKYVTFGEAVEATIGFNPFGAPYVVELPRKVQKINPRRKNN